MNISLEDIRDQITQTVKFALEEDIGSGDITAMLIPESQVDVAEVITREDCVVCGQTWFNEVFKQLGDRVELEWHINEGDQVPANTKLVTLRGNTRDLVTGERSALNFLQTLSGTATLSRQYAQKVHDTQITILDTRKTIPGLRTAQKYAVAIGGCSNHRIGLFDAFLIKENHIAACGGIPKAIESAKRLAPGKKVEVEVESLKELEQAVAAKADVVMLDNFSEDMLEQAFAIQDHQSLYEISGNIELDNIKQRFKEYKHYVSSGALTKHLQAIDLSFRLK